MRTLFLDIASHEKAIALVTDTGAVVQALADHTDEASLLPAIEGFLRTHSASFLSLTALAAVTGPGGFMSLRTGMALMNALQWKLQIPMAGIHLSDLWKTRVISGQRSAVSDVVWIHSTKKEVFFIRGFGSFEKKWKEPELITLAELQRTMTTPTPFVGEMLDEQRVQLPYFQEISDIRTLQDVLPTIIGAARFEKKPLLPWYGRGA
jgi:tRNA A37 threonylcarbamoyladenosine modification protein TsaB